MLRASSPASQLQLCARFPLLSCILSLVLCFPKPDPGQSSCCPLHSGPVALEEVLGGCTIPMDHGKQEGREARLGLCLLEKIWSNTSELPRPFMWYQQPGSQATEQEPLSSSLYQLAVVTPSTPTASSQHSGAGSCFPMSLYPPTL